MDLEGTGNQAIYSNPMEFPERIAVDMQGGKVYWSAVKNQVPFFQSNLRRANLDGSLPELLFSDIDGLGGLGVDHWGGKLYWFESQAIRRSNLDGSSPETVVTHTFFGSPTDMMIDLNNSRLYWLWNAEDTTGAKMQRSFLNGSGVQDVTPSGLNIPWGTALYSGLGKIYLTDELQVPHRLVIRRANLNGTGLVTLVDDGSQGQALLGIAVDTLHGKIYWTDYSGGRIRRADLDGSGVVDVLSGLAGPGGIAVALPPVFGDVFPASGDFQIDVDDLLYVLDGFADAGQFPAADIFPCNGNTVIDVDDILAELDAFSGNPACVWSNGMWVSN